MRHVMDHDSLRSTGALPRAFGDAMVAVVRAGPMPKRIALSMHLMIKHSGQSCAGLSSGNVLGAPHAALLPS